LVIPQEYDGFPAGFPVSYPPDGMTRSDAPGGMSIWDPNSSIDLTRPLNHTDAATQQFFLDVTNPPDSDESESEELTDAELIEAIVESTCLNTVDNWGEPAIRMLTSNPGFTILRREIELGTALCCFQTGDFAYFSLVILMTP
jgi:hypothetical protein